jgi:ferredoxin--NADP+ reductase
LSSAAGTQTQEEAPKTAARKSIKEKMHVAVLTERVDVAGPEAAIFKIAPKGHDLFDFKPGQYATLGLDVGSDFVARAYSIASSPYTRDHLELYINEIKEGQLTPALFNLRHGDELHYMGPKGVFTLAKSEARNVLLIATGTGLAPYVSMLRTLWIDTERGQHHGRALTLVHGVRYTGDLGYRWELDGMARDEAFNLLYLPMASRPEDDRHWTPEVGRGRITALLEGPSSGTLPAGVEPRRLEDRLPPQDTAVFLCGNPDMIRDSTAILSGQGYRDIFVEEYW